MRRFTAAALLFLLCAVWAGGSFFWVNTRLNQWEAHLSAAHTALEQQDHPEVDRSARALSASFAGARPGLVFFFSKTLLTGLESQLQAIGIYNTPDSAEDLKNAIIQTQLQLDQLRRLTSGFF